MVLYFSATGNTEFIAKELAKRLDDECLNLLERIKKQDHSPIYSEKPYVICAPVYVCEIPRFLAKYLKKLPFSGSRDVYFILTSGGYCGPSGLLLKNIFKAKGMDCHGHAEFKMPRNYVANDSYPMLEKAQVEERISNSRIQLETVAADIRSGNSLHARHVFLFETLVTLPFNPVWCKYKLRADDFYAKENCIGCGMCERLCPLNNIKLKEKRPTWGNECTHCMACIGNCPVNAIEYGDITKDKEPYNFGKYRYLVESAKK